MAKIIGKIVKRIARIFWAISNKLFFISAKLLKEKIACYETKTYDFKETTELMITWERGEDGKEIRN
jgi:ribosomal protein S17E